jgi:NADH dehydrogenase FAD-containing subunit
LGYELTRAVQVLETPNMYALGDCADIATRSNEDDKMMHVFSKASLRSAYMAETQAAVCAENIAALAHKSEKQSLARFPEAAFGTKVIPVMAIISLGLAMSNKYNVRSFERHICSFVCLQAHTTPC